MIITPMMAYEAAVKVEAAFRLHPTIGPLLAKKERFGCLVSFMDQEGDTILEAYVGQKPKAYREKQMFVREKLERVTLMHELQAHILSRQSEDESAEPPKYAGAAILYKWGGSVCGYPSRVDEFFVLSWFVQLGIISSDEALTLLRAHPNKYFDKSKVEDMKLLQQL